MQNRVAQQQCSRCREQRCWQRTFAGTGFCMKKRPHQSPTVPLHRSCSSAGSTNGELVLCTQQIFWYGHASAMLRLACTPATTVPSATVRAMVTACLNTGSCNCFSVSSKSLHPAIHSHLAGCCLLPRFLPLSAAFSSSASLSTARRSVADALLPDAASQACNVVMASCDKASTGSCESFVNITCNQALTQDAN